MTKTEFDDWFKLNYKTLRKALCYSYPKSRRSIDMDLSDFYIHCIDKVLPDLIKPDSYVRQFIFNRHYVYFSKRKDPPDKKYFKLQVFSDCSEQELKDIRVIDDEYRTIYDKVLLIVNKLPLDYKILYDYYYIKGLSTREIGKILGISYTGVSFQLKDLRKRVKSKLTLDDIFDN